MNEIRMDPEGMVNSRDSQTTKQGSWELNRWSLHASSTPIAHTININEVSFIRSRFDRDHRLAITYEYPIGSETRTYIYQTFIRF